MRSVTFGIVLAGMFAASAAGQEAVTIKLRGAEKGDKVEVTKTRVGTVTVTAGGMKKAKKEEYEYVYTEKVIEKPEGSPRPTRVDRTYEVARETDPITGEFKFLSYSGKTVEIQVSPIKGVGYIFIVRGNAIQPPEVDDFLYEFQGSPKPGEKEPKPPLTVLIPKDPVKVGEEWTTDYKTIAALMGDAPFRLDRKKSKITGKLAKTYEKNGAKWGVIELKIVMEVVPSAQVPASGTITCEVTIDGVIDGSVRDRTVKLKGDGSLALMQEGVKMEMKVEQEETVETEK